MRGLSPNAFKCSCMRKICAQIEMQLVDAVSECARMEQQRQMHSECIKRMLVNVAIAECTEYALKSCQNASECTFYIIASVCAACHMQKYAIHNGMHRNASKIHLNAAGENDTAYGRKRHLSRVRARRRRGASGEKLTRYGGASSTPLPTAVRTRRSYRSTRC